MSDRLRPLAAAVLLALACGLFVARPALADERAASVVLVSDAAIFPLARRLQQEIESLGLRVTVLTADDPQAVAQERAALEQHAVAAIHITPTGGGDVDMTIVDRAGGKSISWKLVAPSEAEATGSELLATRTVELLRATLLELAGRQSPEPTAQPAARRAPESSPASSRQRSLLSMGAGPALLYSRHFRPGALVQATLTWLPVAHGGVAASVLAPLVPLRLTSPQGSVDLFATIYRFGAALEIGAASSPVLVRGVLGLELDQLRFVGRPIPSYEGASNTRLAWSPFASLAPRFRVAASCYVVGELALALAYPQTVVRVASHEVTEWGRPVASAALGVELAWPGSHE